MEKTTEKMLEEEIRAVLDHLSDIPTNDHTDRKEVVDELERLYKMRTEDKKIDAEKGETCDRRIKMGIDIAAIVLPLMFYGAWMKMGFQFEQTGSFTSTTFRNLFQKFRPAR